MQLLAISGLILVVYLPIAALTTLGLLALWNKWHSPKLWQVIAATACISLLPWLVTDPPIHRGVWLSLGSGFLAYVPVLIPAVLWTLQRRGSDGEFSLLAKRCGSLLVAYIVLVVLVMPVSVIGLAILSNLRG